MWAQVLACPWLTPWLRPCAAQRRTMGPPYGPPAPALAKGRLCVGGCLRVRHVRTRHCSHAVVVCIMVRAGHDPIDGGESPRRQGTCAVRGPPCPPGCTMLHARRWCPRDRRCAPRDFCSPFSCTRGRQVCLDTCGHSGEPSERPASGTRAHSTRRVFQWARSSQAPADVWAGAARWGVLCNAHGATCRKRAAFSSGTRPRRPTSASTSTWTAPTLSKNPSPSPPRCGPLCACPAPHWHHPRSNPPTTRPQPHAYAQDAARAGPRQTCGAHSGQGGSAAAASRKPSGPSQSRARLAPAPHAPAPAPFHASSHKARTALDRA